MATSKARCVTCNKDKAVLKCEGCSQTFCYNHVMEHRQELGKQLEEVEVISDSVRKIFTEQTAEPNKHALIQQINNWEKESIDKIRQTAEEARQMLLKYTAKYNSKLEVRLNKLTHQLQESRQENDFFEIDLQQWKQQLAELNEELNKPSTIAVKSDNTTLIEKISVDISCKTYFVAPLNIPNINANAQWIQNGITVAGSNGSGNGLNQLNNSHGIYVGDDQTIYVADFDNHRVIQWKSGEASGQVVAGGNGSGNRNDQLNYPSDVVVDKHNNSLIISDYSNKRVVRWPCQNGTCGKTIISDVSCWGLAMDNDGNLYASDRSKHEVKRWKMGDTNGTVVAGGNGQGNRLDQLNDPLYIFVDHDHSVYVADGNNHRVVKWIKGEKEGIVVAGGQGQGNGLGNLNTPAAMVVDQSGTIYVADYNNYRIMRWPKGATQGSIVVGGNGSGAQPNQFNGCCDLSFDQQGNLYVADCNNHRVQRFNVET